MTLVAVACGSSDAGTTGSSPVTTVATPTSTAAVAEAPAPTTTAAPAASREPAPTPILSGVFDLPAAAAIGDTGFHQVLTTMGTSPVDVVAGGRLVVRLRDASQPNQECDRQHPLSGCATVDWSDFEERPGVPAGGVFDNRVSVGGSSEATVLFLSETGSLARVPDAYKPT